MRTTRLLPVTVALSALILTACGDEATPGAGSPTGTPTTAPSEPTDPTTEPTTEPTTPSDPATSPDEPTGTRDVTVYWVKDTERGPRLYAEVYERPATVGVIRDAVDALLTEEPRDPDYQDLWPDDQRVLGADIEGTTAVVDLSEAPNDGLGSSFEDAALQALVYTVRAAAPEITGVRILIEGTETETIWGHVDTSTTLTPAAPENILAAVQIESPQHGATVSSPVTFSGEATVFEATVSWQVTTPDGELVEDGFVTASEGAPGRGDWAAEVELDPGDYVFRAFESSAEDGSETHVDDKAFTVS